MATPGVNVPKVAGAPRVSDRVAGTVPPAVWAPLTVTVNVSGVFNGGERNIRLLACEPVRLRWLFSLRFASRKVVAYVRGAHVSSGLLRLLVTDRLRLVAADRGLHGR